jgi:uncharacterized protein YbjQ (UPF0145 family)
MIAMAGDRDGRDKPGHDTHHGNTHPGKQAPSPFLNSSINTRKRPAGDAPALPGPVFLPFKGPASRVQSQQPEAAMIVTTTNDVADHKIVQYLGIVRGITVRSRSVVGNFGAQLQALFGGNISIYTGLAERARKDAYEMMVQHAVEQGANGVIAMRYDANEIGPGITEVLAYGTAVVLEKTASA